VRFTLVPSPLCLPPCWDVGTTSLLARVGVPLIDTMPKAKSLSGFETISWLHS
jgi:hypothetical protein